MHRPPNIVIWAKVINRNQLPDVSKQPHPSGADWRTQPTKTHGTPFTDDRVVRKERRMARSGLDQSVYTTRTENVDRIVAGLVSDKHERHALVKNK